MGAGMSYEGRSKSTFFIFWKFYYFLQPFFTLTSNIFGYLCMQNWACQYCFFAWGWNISRQVLLAYEIFSNNLHFTLL